MFKKENFTLPKSVLILASIMIHNPQNRADASEIYVGILLAPTNMVSVSFFRHTKNLTININVYPIAGCNN